MPSYQRARQKKDCRTYSTPISTLHRHSQSTIRSPDEQKEEKRWRAISYINGVSEAAARLFAHCGIMIAHKPAFTPRTQTVRQKSPQNVMEKP